MGWTYLASLDEESRAAVAPWLLPMVYLNLRLWKYESPIDPDQTEALEGHGAPDARVLHAALVDALRTLIVPGLRELRIDTGRVEAWLDRGAPTDTPPTDLVP
jgi:hypothetical protein